MKESVKLTFTDSVELNSEYYGVTKITRNHRIWTILRNGFDCYHVGRFGIIIELLAQYHKPTFAYKRNILLGKDGRPLQALIN